LKTFLQGLSRKYICYEVLTSLGLESANLGRYSKIVSFGHNEYWTEESLDNVRSYVKNGGYLLVLGGNSAWWKISVKDERIVKLANFPRPIEEQNFLRLNFRDGGYPIQRKFSSEQEARAAGLPAGVYETSGGLRIEDEDHWLFQGVESKDVFGDQVPIVWSEIDGVDISQLQLESESKGRIRILASGWLTRQGGIKNVGVCIESSFGQGKVLNLGSNGWIRVFSSNDPEIRIVAKNIFNQLELMD
jgi:hypothetical protein